MDLAAAAAARAISGKDLANSVDPRNAAVRLRYIMQEMRADAIDCPGVIAGGGGFTNCNLFFTKWPYTRSPS
jgi:hypothetical protein